MADPTSTAYKGSRSALASSGLAPGRLELAITERVLLQENEANLATLDALRGLGLRIAAGDFGTGCPSLSYLRPVPLDEIKIDRCFSSGACFDMTAVTESIERPEQMSRIRHEAARTSRAP